MAANPIPPQDDPVIVYSNASTGATVDVLPGEEIVWQNHTIFPVTITVSPVNGVYPFADNTFPVPAMENQSYGTWTSPVLPGTPTAQYPFTRTGHVPMGSGKIIVLTGKP
jgi:hypothetical protein